MNCQLLASSGPAPRRTCLAAEASPTAWCPEVCKGLGSISYVLRKEKQGAFGLFVCLFKESGAFYGGICRRGRGDVERFQYLKDRGEECLPGVTLGSRWRQRERLSTDDKLKIAVKIN